LSRLGHCLEPVQPYALVLECGEEPAHP
jgi:hypothetical protein